MRELRSARKTRKNRKNWLRSWLVPLKRVLKPAASLYVCSEWQSSCSVERVLARIILCVTASPGNGKRAARPRTTGKTQRRTSGSARFRKIQFSSGRGENQTAVIAPYRMPPEIPGLGSMARNTARRRRPILTDISVPFWSMPENTEHPTQKPEKLCKADTHRVPLLGSCAGPVWVRTSAVAAHKLGHRYIGIEREKKYCLFALKRLKLSDEDPAIQGYSDGCFERNSGK